MGVEKDEDGQSVLEFLLMFPVLLGITLILVRVNGAIQVSIVNQQYARAQLLFLAFNSPVFPQLRYREKVFVPKGFNQMVIGVSDNLATSDEVDYVPKATVMGISRKTRGGGSDESQAEPNQRSRIRVRTTAAVCTQANVVSGGSAGRFGPILELKRAGGDGEYPLFVANGAYQLTEDSRFDYCREGFRQ